MLLLAAVGCDHQPPGGGTDEGSACVPPDLPTATAEAVTSYVGGAPGLALDLDGQRLLLEHDRGANRALMYDVTADPAVLLYTIEPERADSGFSVAADYGGDLDGDGDPEMAISAVDNPGTYAGVYLYEGLNLEGAGASQVVDGTGYDAFGADLAFVEDRLVVGVPLAGEGGLSVIRSFDGSYLSRDDVACSPDGEEYGFGWGVDDAGDMDGDGVEDVLVTGYGAAWMVDGTGLLEDCSLTATPLAFEEDIFISDVKAAAIGDSDGDGHPDVAVALSGNFDSRIYVFTDGSGSPSGTFLNDADEQDGVRVAPAEDRDGDGRNDFYAAYQSWTPWRSEGVFYPRILLVPGPVCGTVEPDAADEIVSFTDPDTMAGDALVSWGDALGVERSDYGDDIGVLTEVYSVE